MPCCSYPLCLHPHQHVQQVGTPPGSSCCFLCRGFFFRPHCRPCCPIPDPVRQLDAATRAQLAVCVGSPVLTSSALMQMLMEDAAVAALATALAGLPYSAAEVRGWLDAVNKLPSPCPPQPFIFTVFRGTWFPAFDAASLGDLAKTWHVLDFMQAQKPICEAVEATILQRFATDEAPPDGWIAALSAAPGQLVTLLEARWAKLLAEETGTFVEWDYRLPGMIGAGYRYNEMSFLVDYAPKAFAQQPCNLLVWRCASGATVPSSTAQRIAAALFGHSPPFPESPADVSSIILAGLAAGGHLDLIQSLALTAAQYPSHSHSTMHGVMHVRGGQRLTGQHILLMLLAHPTLRAISIAGFIHAARVGDVVAMAWLWEEVSLKLGAANMVLSAPE